MTLSVSAQFPLCDNWASCLQKTVEREPRIGDECTDFNKPKTNVYSEKHPVYYSVQVSDSDDDDDDDES